MSVTMEPGTPEVLAEVDEAVASWQVEGAPVQVHPGDLGWNASRGAEQLAGELWLWRRGGSLVAVGMGDGDVVRMALAPDVGADEEVAEAIVADLSGSPGVGAGPGTGQVEARFGVALRDLLRRRGWVDVEPWTPLRRSLAEPVEECGLVVESLSYAAASARVLRDRVAVQRAAFATSTFTLERWRTMAPGPAYRRGRCLVGYDTRGLAVAAATVWSAGVGRPGLIEPLGVRADEQGRGNGRAMTLAAAAALREMGASSVTVCTPSSNVGAVAAYASAGFERLPEVPDFGMPPPGPGLSPAALAQVLLDGEVDALVR